ncbi:MAG: zinc ribbon domain-containing protein [Thermoguttaceae bacterium]|nr:zinc ribbon domain-containing protein [Thermoguttaceae bacterium]
MPIYEYVCADCGHEFEYLLRGGESPACPSCGHSNLNKQLSVPAAPALRAAAPCCPAKESGSCAMSGECGGNRCGLSQWDL